MNPIDTIKAGYIVNNSNFEYIGKSGEFHIPNCDGSVKWVQLLIQNIHGYMETYPNHIIEVLL